MVFFPKFEGLIRPAKLGLVMAASMPLCYVAEAEACVGVIGFGMGITYCK